MWKQLMARLAQRKRDRAGRARRAAAPAPVFKIVPGSPQEIDHLHDELGHADEDRRERAYGRLLKIGPPALLHDLTARKFGAPVQVFFLPRGTAGDPNRVRLTFRLIEEIQKKHGPQAIRHGGLAFTGFGDQVWKIPPPGGETKLELGVKITNVGKTPIRFFKSGFSIPTLVRADGVVLDCGTLLNGFVVLKEPFSPLLATGETYSQTIVLAKICRSPDGKDVRLQGYLKYGALFDYQGLTPGRYYLSHCCANEPNALADLQTPKDGSRSWVGAIQTLYLPIDIR